MINAVLVFNNNGQPRLTKFYTQLDTQTQQSLIAQIYRLVSQRPASACNFLPLPPLLSQGASSSASGPSDAPTQITYRTYATLSFIMISTSTESPLALIDLIQVFVEALDRMFENVCELDLIFGYETLHAVLGEMIVGGVVVETHIDKIVAGVRAQEGSLGKKKAVQAASSSLSRGALPGLGAWSRPKHRPLAQTTKRRNNSRTPIVYTTLRHPFVVAEVTVSRRLGTRMGPRRPGDLHHTLTETTSLRSRTSRPPCKWVKADVELSSGTVNASSVRATANGADWCLSPLAQGETGPGVGIVINSLRIKVERVGDALWIWYQVPTASP
ncbi:AP complex mu/sigma subunit [Penicillium sp. DV-2018c]|nr:AP complex mu/sigma subunit [Penicillium sp. DV-2018c]